MSEAVGYGIEILVGMIAVPWFVWATVAIFNLKQENAVMKMEMDLMREIKDLIRTQKGLTS